MMIVSYILGHKNYPIPYNLKRNIFYLLFSIALVYVAFVVFDRNIIIGNMMLALFLITAAFLERKELSLIFRKK